MAFSMIAIAFLSWIVYGHHMFVSGMNPALGMAFMVTTMIIAVPSAIKTFNWLGTLWGARIQFTVPMLNTLAFVSMFVIGGLSGIFMASTPVDIYIQDTYFIVAHIHYVVFGGSIFGAFAAIYYWFPKMFGRMMNTVLGHLHFWPTFVFFNLTFFPMHIIGVGGQMRRIYNPMQYEFLKDQQHWNVLITYRRHRPRHRPDPLVINFFWSLFAGKPGADEPVERQYARVDHAVAAAAPELGPDAAHGSPGSLRVQLADSREDFLPQSAPPVVATGARAGTDRGGDRVAYRSGAPTLADRRADPPRGLVTNTGAALAVPDWPSTFGHNMILFPWSRMVGGIFYEHSHRLIGALVGLLTLALAGALVAGGRSLRRLGLMAVVAVVVQGLLGGLASCSCRHAGHLPRRPGPGVLRPAGVDRAPDGAAGRVAGARRGRPGRVDVLAAASSICRSCSARS